MIVMHTIAIILPYYGKFPNYFDLWLNSCKNNPTIDFYIITDLDLKSISSNIIVVNLTLQELRRRFSAFLGFDAALHRPYKLCDYKPIYGYAFPEIIDRYDFWGYCDCDLIFGDIRRFLTEDILERYNYIGGLGHFHIQKSKDKAYWDILRNARSLEGKSMNDVYLDNNNYVFDELPAGVPYEYFKEFPNEFYSLFEPSERLYDSMTNEYPGFIDLYNCYLELGPRYKKTMYYKYRDKCAMWNNRSPYAEMKQYIIYRYIKGKLYRIYSCNGAIQYKEVLYAHFFRRKMTVNLPDPGKVDSYLIIPNRFVADRAIGGGFEFLETCVFHTLRKLQHKQS